MKRSLCKTSSAPEQLPRISLGQKTSAQRRPESKSRHYSDSDIRPWCPLTEVDTMALPAVLHNRPGRADRRIPSETHGSLSARSLPFRRGSSMSFTQGMVTILHNREDVDDDDFTSTPCHLHVRVPDDEEAPGEGSVQLNKHAHGDRCNQESYVGSGLRMNHREDRFSQRDEGVESSPCTVRTTGGRVSRVHHGGVDYRDGLFPRPGHGPLHGLTYRPRHMTMKRHPPRTPAVSPTGDLGAHAHIGDLGAHAPIGDLGSHAHIGDLGAHANIGGLGDHVHLGDLGDLGHLRHPGDMTPTRSGVAQFLVPQCGEHNTSTRSPDSIHAVQTEDEQCTGNDDTKTKITCSGLTQEVLTSGLYSNSARKEDRVFDWLAECDSELVPASLPTHLPEINRQKRYNPSIG
ncbi:uncharacterized protein LOC124119582 [Haliotis rufescens]|uniref:uncharacterized protein LOC124119582 n=1 Tax=Haliotis rufescens TaxID=6454 RepID=UPI00201EECC8|nr:uncharacterized protein LOC124119582 [Haliotis rufescens]